MAANKKKISMSGIILKSTGRAMIYIAIIALFYLGMNWAYLFGYSIFNDTAMSNPPGLQMEVVINEGASDSKVADMLQNRGLIKDGKIFFIQSIFYDYTIYPGTYTLNSAMTVKEILTEISQEPESLKAEESTNKTATEAATEPEDTTKDESSQ